MAFRDELFAHSAFSAAAMACPASVARSVRRRQAAFFHGRMCAWLALSRLGVAVQDVGMGPLGEPLWPDGIVGSITHTGRLAGAVAQFGHSARGLGIDLEELSSGTALRRTQDVFLSARESAVLARAGGSGAGDMALVIAFSAKESFYKAVFPSVQRFFDFDTIEIVGLDWEESALHFTVRQDLSRDFPGGRRCVSHFRALRADGHVLTTFSW